MPNTPVEAQLYVKRQTRWVLSLIDCNRHFPEDITHLKMSAGQCNNYKCVNGAKARKQSIR